MAGEILRAIPWRMGKHVSHEIDSGNSQLINDNSLTETLPSGGVDDAYANGTNWRVWDTNLALSSGKADWTSYTGTKTRKLVQINNSPLDPSAKEYRVSATISDYTSGNIKITSGSFLSPAMDSLGTWTFDMSPKTGGGNFHIVASTNAVLKVSEVSAYEIKNNYRQLDYNSYNLSFGGNNPNENLVSPDDWLMTEPIPGPITSDFVVFVKRNNGSSNLKLDVEGTLSTNAGIQNTRDNNKTGWESMTGSTMTFENSGTTSPTPEGDYAKWDIAENGIMPLMRFAWENDTASSLTPDWSLSLSFMRPM